MGKLSRSKFKFRRNDSVGSADAETDVEFLEHCFYETEDLTTIRDTHDRRRILVGRTGTGKTALLKELLRREEYAIEIDPEDLSLQYLSNSTILPYLDALGVNLDLFYRLLWRHVFAVELIKAKYHLPNGRAKKGVLQRLYDQVFGDATKKKAIDYLLEWGGEFWEETEVRVREVTNAFEEQLQSELGINISALRATAQAGGRHSSAERQEIVNRAQAVVNKIQIKRLSDVIQLLADDIFTSDLPRFYLVIDRLDHNWADDHVRYRLVRALIETIRDFLRVRNVKIIIALRRDLLDRVIRLTRDAGFQEEKYESLYLPLRWSSKQLMELLDLRINALVRRRYTKEQISWRDLLPAQIDRQPTGKYIIDRTMYRPRDVIAFFNCCIHLATDRPEITMHMVRSAEAEYSRLRFRSLADEWHADYPSLLAFADILKKRPRSFQVKDLSLQSLEEKSLEVAVSEPTQSGPLTSMAIDVANGTMDAAEARRRLIKTLYEVGLIGLKLESFTKAAWSFLDVSTIPVPQITDDTTVNICPVFYRVLGIEAGSDKMSSA